MPRPAISPEKRAKMRSHIRAAVVRIARKRKIAPNDVWAWAEISIRDVAEEADISIGTFYKYFKDRADLAESLWSEPVDQLRNKMQAAFDAQEEAVEKLRVLLEGYAEFALTNPKLFTHILLSVPAGQYREPRQRALSEEPFFSNLILAFEEGQRSGKLKDFDPYQMAQTFWASIHGCMALAINLDRYEFDEPNKRVAAMIEGLLTMVKA